MRKEQQEGGHEKPGVYRGKIRRFCRKTGFSFCGILEKGSLGSPGKKSFGKLRENPHFTLQKAQKMIEFSLYRSFLEREKLPVGVCRAF